MLSGKAPVCVTAPTCEEDRMVAEYLNNSDTAVIYPEPVSDREEGAEEGAEEGDDDNDNGKEILPDT